MSFLGRVFSQYQREIWEREQALQQRLGFVPPPVAVQLICSSACDLTCPHCYSNAGKKSSNELSTTEIEELVIDRLPALGSPLFVIAGGEPTLRSDFSKILARLKKHNIPWSMHTHGGHIARHIKEIRGYPPQLVAVSVDGPEQYHDNFRGKKGSFKAALEAISILKSTACKEVVFGTTINRQNADLVNDLFEVYLQSKADSWGLHLITPEGRAGQHSELYPTAAQLRRVASFARQARTWAKVEMDNEWGSAGADEYFYRSNIFNCGAGRFSFVISATGEVVPCTTTDQAESAGNVRQKSLKDIWLYGFEAFRNKKVGDELRHNCNDCWLQTRHKRTARYAAFEMSLFESCGEVALCHHTPAIEPSSKTFIVPQPILGQKYLLSGKIPTAAFRIATILSVAFSKFGSTESLLAQNGTPDAKVNTVAASGLSIEISDQLLRAWLARVPGLCTGPVLIGTESVCDTYLKHYFSCRDKKESTDKCSLPPDKWDLFYGELFYMRFPIQEYVTPGKSPNLDQLQGNLANLEKSNIYNEIFSNLLWLELSTIQKNNTAVLSFLKNLSRYVLITNILNNSYAKIQPMHIRNYGWASKAGPGHGYMLELETKTNELNAVVRHELSKANYTYLGAWKRDGLVELEVTETTSPVTLHQEGSEILLDKGMKLILGRLDALSSGLQPATITFKHSWLGEIRLKVSAASTVWDWPAALSPEQEVLVQQMLQKAAAGDEQAANNLERALPFVHQLLRAEVAKNSNEPGAARLRTILATFDKVPFIPIQTPETGGIFYKQTPVPSQTSSPSSLFKIGGQTYKLGPDGRAEPVE